MASHGAVDIDELAAAGTPASMLSLACQEFAGALEEIRCYGASRVEDALTLGARQRLIAAVKSCAYEPAPQQVGDVRQDVDMIVLRPGAGQPAVPPAFSPLLALAHEYTAFLKTQAEVLNQPWLADFQPTGIYVQRYGASSRGISPHRDSRRFIKLVSIFSLGAPAEFRLCRDRRGSPLKRYRLSAGDLILLRAPGFGAEAGPGPLHSVSRPAGRARYSITLRMERPGPTRLAP